MIINRTALLRRLTLGVGGLALFTAMGAAWAASLPGAPAPAPRVCPEGTLPDDIRLGPLKDLDGYFPFHPPKTAAQWAKRSAYVRRQMLVALGLWPMPERTPLQTVIYGKLDEGDYTVEKVYFQSYPGFYVTGSLYRPKGKSSKVPGILCPHGHWDNGRFYDLGEENVRRQIVQGAERFEDGGRSPLQSRCVQLARMGCVVFFYDMIGYADSVQIPESLAHGFAKQRPEMNTMHNWGLFSPQAEAHLQSVMGLQTWDSIRALDFLMSLPDVDPHRLGVTGASGGGTQTYILCAVDPRPAVEFPAVMVSTAMQGGCTCENACYLRIGTGNVEFAALFAPKPLGMTAANDWTKEMPTKGFPQLKELYTLLGAPQNVMLRPFLQFGHNYNYVSRAAMYPWFNRHFHLGWKEPIVEEDYPRLTKSEATVWNSDHPKPEGGPAVERQLLRYMTEDAQRQLKPACESIAEYRRIVGGAMDVMIGRSLQDAGEVLFREVRAEDKDFGVEREGLLRNVTYHEELPVIVLQPKLASGGTVIWIDGQGKSGLFNGESPRPEITELLNAGDTVIGVDLLHQGEFLANGKRLTQARRVNNPREAAEYTYCYNRPLFAQRADDILTVIKYARGLGGTVQLAGLDGGGPWVAAGVAQARGAVQSAAIDTEGFRFGKILDVWDVNLLPGGAKYFDLPGMIALGAPAKLWLAGEGEQAPEIVARIYAKAGASHNLKLAQPGATRIDQAAATWLLGQSGK
jgi:dienelactone hydrolase